MSDVLTPAAPVAKQGPVFERRDPISGEVVTRAAAMDAAAASAVADRAAAAFPGWAAVGPNARRTLLLKASAELESRREDVVSIMMRETGAAAGWCHFNVMLAVSMLREAGSITTQITGEVIPSDKPGVIAMGIRQPAGVVVGIAPWNAPVILATRAVSTALACGNTVILKASEACPGLHQLLIEIIAGAGFPEGVVNIVTNAPHDAAEVVETLIAHPKVRRVSFTGSTHVGRIIGELCGRNLKPALLELGGKAPLIVLDDADLDVAVNAAAFGAFMHQGQICMSTERIIVDEKVADAFVAKLAAKASSLPFGNPRTDNVVLGSLISREAVLKVQDLVADAKSKGAVVASGGEAHDTFMAATVLDGVKPGMKIFYDESFGPVVSVIRVRGDEEAIAVANDTEYGLSSAVFSRDVARAMKVARRVESGICHINGPTVQDEAQMPFGGVKGSGYGRFGGRQGIEFFTETRWITIETEEPHFPF